MPKTIYLPEDDGGYRNSGLAVTWTKTSQRLSFFGWYDTAVGIQGDAMTLREFCDKLGITKKDVERAFKD